MAVDNAAHVDVEEFWCGTTLCGAIARVLSSRIHLWTSICERAVCCCLAVAFWAASGQEEACATRYLTVRPHPCTLTYLIAACSVCGMLKWCEHKLSFQYMQLKVSDLCGEHCQALAGLPKFVGWARRSEQHSCLRTAATSECTSTCLSQHGTSPPPCIAVCEGSFEQQHLRDCSDAGECPSLKSSCLAFLSPHVQLICLASGRDLQLPSHIKATLLGLARRRGDLTDAAVLALVDRGFAQLDLSSCNYIRPTTLVRALEYTQMLQKLDVSGCHLTNSFVYSLSSSVPHLLVLRLGGVDVSGIDFLAWKQLIPGVKARATPDAWEEISVEQPRGLGQLRWMVWEDVPGAVRQLYLRRWPKLNLNAHLGCSSGEQKKCQNALPKDVFPGVALDWEEFSTVPSSAWRIPMPQYRPCKQRQSAAKRGIFIDELEEDEEEGAALVNDVSSTTPSVLCSACSALDSSTDVPSSASHSGRTPNNRSQDVLQRWLDSDCL